MVKLEVAALHYLPHYLDFLDWKECTWFHRWGNSCDQNARAAMVALLLEKKERYPSNTRALDRYMCFEDWSRLPEVLKRSNQHDMGIVAYLSSEYREKLTF